MKSLPRLVLGSRNKKKLGELKDLLGDLPIELSDLSPFPDAPEVDETGTTFEENAKLKATMLAPALNAWVLGEDSGLCVPKLGGAPGIFSARYAGTHGDNAANNAKLLDAMKDVHVDDRAAYFVSAVALANPAGEVVAVAEDKCHGLIARELRGHGGFGYDPLFLIREYHATFGELSETVKHALSHRGRAIAKLRPVIRKMLHA